MSTDALAVILVFGGVWVVAIVGIIAKTITRNSSQLSCREAEDIRERLATIEARLDTLTQAVVGTPVISPADAKQIAEEAARIAEVRAGARLPAAERQ